MGIFGKPNIGKMKEKGDVKGLIKALRDKNSGVRKKVKAALNKIRGKSKEKRSS